MGREPTWTPQEDAILLRTVGQSAAYVNEQLTQAGFERRSPSQIKYRRNRIKNTPSPGDAPDPEQELVAAIQRRRSLTSQQAHLEEELDALNRRIHELARLLGGDSP